MENKPEDKPPEDNKLQIPLDRERVIAELMATNPQLAAKLFRKFGLHRSTETYFADEHTVQIKQIIDDMIVDGMNREFLFADYWKWKPNTIRLKIFSSVKCICEKLDPDGRYKQWRSEIEIAWMAQKEGIVMKYVARGQGDPNKPLLFKARISAPEGAPVDDSPLMEQESNRTDWKEKIQEFIETAGEKAFLRLSDLKLEEEDKNWIRSLFSGMDNFTVRGDKDTIKVIHAKMEGGGVDIK